MIERIAWRSVGHFVALDVLTYGLVYWVVMPLVSPIVSSWSVVVQTGLGHVLVAVRLALVGMLVARAYKNRHGIERRGDVVPSVVVGASIAGAFGVGLAIAGAALIGAESPAAGMLALGWTEWLIFGVLGALVVEPGEPARIPLKYADMAAGSAR